MLLARYQCLEATRLPGYPIRYVEGMADLDSVALQAVDNDVVCKASPLSSLDARQSVFPFTLGLPAESGCG